MRFSPRVYNAYSYQYLVRFTVPSMDSFVLSPVREPLVLFQVEVPFLHYWGYLARLVIVMVPRLYSWVALLTVFLFVA